MFFYLQRVPVADMETEEICKNIEDKGFSKRAEETIPSPPHDDEL